MPPFLPGLELSGAFYAEAVRPLLDEHFPGLPHSAARLGTGSEVLGYDTARSADHEWGPRLELFLREEDLGRVGDRLVAALADRLPKRFRGWPTNFGPEEAAIRCMEPTDGPVRHRVGVSTLAAWFDAVLGFDPRAGVTTLDWLATPSQRLAEVTGGAVFADGLGELEAARQRLRWYPDQLWWYLLACQWRRVAEQEAFPGRCAEVGDDLGNRLATARLVRDLVRLALLVERRHAPYDKWLGTAFASALPLAGDLGPALRGALAAPTWPEREAHLCVAYRLLAARHNALGVTDPLDEATRPYHDRPFQVVDGGRFAAALRGRLTGETATLPPVGSVDQFVDSTAVLTHPRRARAAVRAVLGGPAQE